jgi:hypothetical protein
MKLPVTFLNPDGAVKTEQAAPRMMLPEDGLEIEQVVSVTKKLDPSILTCVPTGPEAAFPTEAN